MAKLNANWFKNKLVEKGKSQRALARHLGLDPGAITLTLQGKRRLQMDEARQISIFLSEPLSDILRAAGLPIDGAAKPEPATSAPSGSDDIVQAMIDRRAELSRQIEALDAAIAVMKK